MEACNSALASGAGTALDSLVLFLLDSCPRPLPEAALCLEKQKIPSINNEEF